MVMEGLVGCPRTPTSLPGPLDADATPSYHMPGAEVAGDGHFEHSMARLKLAIPKAPHGGCVVSGAHPHVGKGPAVG